MSGRKHIHVLSNALLAVLLFFLGSCNDVGSDPQPANEPLGTQHPIPWPSLANSSWPMYHGDPQSTGRSKSIGPSMGAVEWRRDSIYSETGVVIGEDSTIYVGTTGSPLGPASLLALRTDGSVKWRFVLPTGDRVVRTTPLVAADGTIYICGRQTGTLYAISPEGTLSWQFSADSWVGQSGINIGLDGSLYFVDGSSTLYCLGANGRLKWRLNDPRFYPDWHSVITFSPDGNTLYVPGIGVCILAVDVSSRTVKWAFGNVEFQNLAPICDSQGHIYVLGGHSSFGLGKPTLFCLDQDGSVRWLYTHGNSFDPVSTGDPVLDPNGNIYFAFDTLYSVNYSGILNWKLALTGSADSPLVCDASGIVYAAVSSSTSSTQILAVTPAGSIRWQVALDIYYPNDNSPALTADSRLLLPTWRSTSIFKFR